MTMTRDQIREAAECPTCGANKGEPCTFWGKGSAKRNRVKANHHDRQIIAQAAPKTRPTPPPVPGPKATVITDASWDSRTLAGGWAAWIRIDGVQGPIKGSGPLLKQPDQADTAEIMAAINGIYLARSRGAGAILLQTDCVLVVSMIRQTAKQKQMIRWNDYADRADINLGSLTAKHVKGHTRVDDARSYVNRWCDSEAKRHMRVVRSRLNSLDQTG
jgi:ribonuclease HI